MAGKFISGVHATVTAATSGGYLTVSSATGLYVGAKCWLSLTDNSAQDFVEITSISGTTVGVRLFRDITKTGPNYGRFDASSYNGGGFLDQIPQHIYNRNDAALT